MAHNPRRNALKSLGVILPAAWATPLVESVILPAHAQTSVCDSITARSEFDDAILRAIGIFDSEFNNLDSACCDSPLEVTLGSLPPGTYFVSMGISTDEPTPTTLTVTTCTDSCVVTRDISGGNEDGSGNVMVEVTLPGGECREVGPKPGP